MTTLLAALILAVSGAAAAPKAKPVAKPALAPELARGLPEPLAAPLAADPMKTTIHRLDNGLTVYLSPNPGKPRVTAWIAVRAGGRHDPSDASGMAHYLEHMLFKGSERLGTIDFAKEKVHLDRISALYERLFDVAEPAERDRLYKEIDAENIEASRYAVPNEMAKAYQALGIDPHNAFTSQQEIVYTADVPKNRLEAWAVAEAERFSRPVFRLFQSELETVYEEKNRSLDNAERILRDALLDKLFTKHPYAHSVLGTIEHLKNPSLAKMYAFFERFYVPNNMAIVLSGDFEREKALALLRREFGALQPKAVPSVEPAPVPPLGGVERVAVSYEAEEKVEIAWPTVPHSHPDADALTVLDMLMDNAATGLINLKLVQAQKVKAAGSSPTMHLNEAGYWSLWAVPKKDQTLEQAEALLMETVDALLQGEFTDDDIRAIVTNFEVDEKLRLESNEARAGVMAMAFTQHEPWERVARSLDRLRRVSKKEVLAAAQKYLGERRVVAYRRHGKPDLPKIQKPSFTKLEIDPARASPFFQKLIALPAQPIAPKWLKEGLDYTLTPMHGAKLYHAPNPLNDLFSASFQFDIGSRNNRRLCAALSLLELSGAGALDAEQYKKKLYSLGTTLSYGCGERNWSFSISGLEKNLQASLDLAVERFLSPNIAPDTLKKMVQVELGAHQDNKKNPGYIHHALGELAKRGPESGVLHDLSDQELLALNEADLRATLKSALAYERRVAYVGSRPAAEAAALLKAGSASVSAPPIPSVTLVKPQAPRVLFTHRDMVQSRVGLFAADGQADPSKYVDAIFYGEYIGGGMSSVIFQEVRERRALAYSAGGGYATGPRLSDDNQVFGALGCQADKTVEAAGLLRDLLKSLPASAPRFEIARQSIEQWFRTDPLTFRQVPGALIAWEQHGLKGDPRPERFKRALAYTLADLEAFSRRWETRPMTLFILGHRDRVDIKGLKALGAFEEKSLNDLFPY